MVGTADSVLIREVSCIQSVLYKEVPLYWFCDEEDVGMIYFVRASSLSFREACISLLPHTKDKCMATPTPHGHYNTWTMNGVLIDTNDLLHELALAHEC